MQLRPRQPPPLRRALVHPALEDALEVADEPLPRLGVARVDLIPLRPVAEAGVHERDRGALVAVGGEADREDGRPGERLLGARLGLPGERDRALAVVLADLALDLRGAGRERVAAAGARVEGAVAAREPAREAAGRADR